MAGLSMPAILAAMLARIGDSAREAQPGTQRAASVAAAIDADSATGGELRFEAVGLKGALREVNFTARRGEIVGLTGLTGAGHQAVIELVTGQRHADAAP